MQIESQSKARSQFLTNYALDLVPKQGINIEIGSCRFALVIQCEMAQRLLRFKPFPELHTYDGEQSMSNTVKLSLVKADMRGPTYLFDRFTRCRVGRAFDNDIRLNSSGVSAWVSPYHCIFEIDPPYIWLRALRTRCGTYVNNLKISIDPEDQPVELRSGDEVQLGNYLFVVHVDGDQQQRKEEPSSLEMPEWIL